MELIAEVAEPETCGHSVARAMCFRSCKLFLYLFSFLLFLLCGCSTYFGYTEKRDVKSTLLGQNEENIRHFARFDFGDDSVELSCFRKYDLRSRTLVEDTVTAVDHYRDFDGDYYIDNKYMNPLKEYEFSVGTWWKRRQKKGDTPFRGRINNENPFLYLLPVAGQIALCYDLMGFCLWGCIDTIAVTGCSCYSMIAWPTVWLGGRFFGWMGNWKLKYKKPGVLRMISYMPFINLFFPFQTPPYMTDGPNRTEERMLGVVARRVDIQVSGQQSLHLGCPVEVELLSRGKVIASGRFVTDSSNGSLQLNEFVQNAISKMPIADKNFTLKVSLFSPDGKSVLHQRKCEFDYAHVMSVAARSELASSLSPDVDCLNKVLLRYRSHRVWRQELLGDDFRHLQERVKALPRK